MQILRILTSVTILLILPAAGLLFVLSGAPAVAAATAFGVLIWICYVGIRSPRIIGESLLVPGGERSGGDTEYGELVRVARDRLEQAAWQLQGSRTHGLSALRLDLQIFESSRALVFPVRNLIGTEAKLFLSTGAVTRLSEAALSEAITLAVLDASQADLGVRSWAAALLLSTLRRIPSRPIEVFWGVRIGTKISKARPQEAPLGGPRKRLLEPGPVLVGWAVLPWISMLLEGVEGSREMTPIPAWGSRALGLNRLEKGQAVRVERSFAANSGTAREVPMALWGLAHEPSVEPEPRAASGRIEAAL